MSAAITAYGIATGQVQLPVPRTYLTPAHVQRPSRWEGFPTIKECRSTNTCIQCRARPAKFYGADFGHGVKCPDCIERRKVWCGSDRVQPAGRF